MAAVPVICAFIGTTQLGWNFGDGTVIKLSYADRTGAGGAVLRRDARRGGDHGAGHLVDGEAVSAAAFPKRCMVFAG